MLKSGWFLFAGDILAIMVITVIGFATHNEIGMPFLPCMGAVFFPLVIAWLLLAMRLGLFESQVVADPKQLWLPAFAMFFAAPFAVVIRGLVLNAPIIPIFALVLSATSAFGMLVWRMVYFLLKRK